MKGGIAARAAGFGGRAKSVSARLRGAGNFDRARMGNMRPSTHLKEAVDAYVMARDGHRCTRCGCTSADSPLTIAHRIAHAQGGHYTPTNLRVLCINCHADSEIGSANRRGAKLLRNHKRYRRAR